MRSTASSCTASVWPICRSFAARWRSDRWSILADTPAYEALDGRYPGALLQHADEHSYGTEFLAYRMSIRTVGSLDEAVEHMARYSSRHSEAVVSENAGTIREFQRRVERGLRLCQRFFGLYEDGAR